MLYQSSKINKKTTTFSAAVVLAEDEIGLLMVHISENKQCTEDKQSRECQAVG